MWRVKDRDGRDRTDTRETVTVIVMGVEIRDETAMVTGVIMVREIIVLEGKAENGLKAVDRCTHMNQGEIARSGTANIDGSLCQSLCPQAI